MAQRVPLSSDHPTDRILGQSPAIHALRTQIRHLVTFARLGSPAVPTVLLTGETGTGKGLVARVLHDSGPRRQGPFIDVHCGAIPEPLLEAEMFGYEPGAFTDARRGKPGLFEAASEGTLFLDEIDALALPLQRKVLKAIEDKRVRRLGAVTERSVDVKLIAATQADLGAYVTMGRFRADLYHRLAVVMLDMPPLRERGEDVVLLAQHFLGWYAATHRLPLKQLSPSAATWLRRYRWPGNVRELSHLMERVALLSTADVVDQATLQRLCLPQGQPASRALPAPASADREVLDEVGRIREALVRTGGNVVRAARLLGLNRNALRYRMRRYGIERPHWEEMPLPAAARDAAGMPRRGDASAGSTRVEPEAPVTGWEQQPVVVLSINLTFPTPTDGEALHYALWTVVNRWEQSIVEKVHEFGGVLMLCSPALCIVLFGIPHALDQIPQLAVQAALALQVLVAEARSAGGEERCPEVRMAAHVGAVQVEAQASTPTGRLLAVGDTLSLPIQLLGYAAPGELLVSLQMARLVGGHFSLEARELTHSAGQANPVEVYSVTGLTRQHAPSAGLGELSCSQFIGRERELVTLHKLLNQVRWDRDALRG